MVEGSGEIRACCAAKNRLGEIRSEGASLKEILHSPESTQFRRQMLDRNNIPEACSRCVEREDAGLESHRLKFNRRVGECADAYEVNPERPHLVEMDLSFSNTCNLDCVMCSSQYSHRWLEIEEKLGLQSGPFRGFATHRMTDKVVAELIELSQDLQRVILKGGEPLFDPQALAYLDGLGKSGFAGEVLVITNLTVWSERVERVLSALPKVKLFVSVDGIGPVYEWIRGIEFEKLSINLKRALQLSSVHSLAPRLTLSAYNIYGLSDYVRWMLDLTKSHAKVHPDNFAQAAMNKHITSRSLPLRDRQTISEEIRELLSGTECWSKTLENYLQLPETPTSELKPFIEWTEKFNQFRERDAFEVIPELDKIRQQV